MLIIVCLPNSTQQEGKELTILSYKANDKTPALSVYHSLGLGCISGQLLSYLSFSTLDRCLCLCYRKCHIAGSSANNEIENLLLSC